MGHAVTSLVSADTSRHRRDANTAEGKALPLCDQGAETERAESVGQEPDGTAGVDGILVRGKLESTGPGPAVHLKPAARASATPVAPIAALGLLLRLPVAPSPSPGIHSLLIPPAAAERWQS